MNKIIAILILAGAIFAPAFSQSFVGIGPTLSTFRPSDNQRVAGGGYVEAGHTFATFGKSSLSGHGIVFFEPFGSGGVRPGVRAQGFYNRKVGDGLKVFGGGGLNYFNLPVGNLNYPIATVGASYKPATITFSRLFGDTNDGRPSGLRYGLYLAWPVKGTPFEAAFGGDLTRYNKIAPDSTTAVFVANVGVRYRF